jgi:hypothetical protein
MLTTGSKWFLGLGLVSFVLAAAYGWTTGGTDLGPITFGYWGGVGDHLGYTMLVSIAVTAGFLGVIALATRDADPRALAQLAGTDEPPVALPPAHLSYWPAIGALGVALMVLGLVVSNVLFIASFFLLLAVVVEWMVLAWSDRATGDPETNRLVRNRVLGPYEVPLVGVLLAGGTVVALSRLFLTSSKEGAVWVATGAGAVIFILGAVLATKPKIPANLVAGLLVVASLGVVSAGVVAAERGERTIHPHSEEPAGTTAEEGTGLQPNIPAGTQHATTTTEAAG